MAECLTIRIALVMAIHNLQRIIIKSDSQLMVNAIHNKISVPRYIINLIEDIRNMFPLIKKISIDYYCRICKREAASTAKSVHR